MADTTVKIFSSDQTGAPTLNNTAGSLIAVLDACLVNGFGLKTCDSVVIASGVGTATISTGHSAIQDGVVLFAGATGSYTALNGERKVTSVGTNTIVFDAIGLPDGQVTGTITVKVAAAGWAKAFAGTNLAAYKSTNQLATGLFLRVDDTTTTYASVRGYETMTDVSTGTGVFPTATQQATSVWYKANVATSRPWWLIGNSSFFYLAIASNGSYNGIMSIYAFGDIVSRKAGDGYRAALFASNSVTAPTDVSYSPVATTNAAYSSRYIARSYASLGSAVAITPNWFDSTLNTSTASGYGGRAFPNPSDNSIVFTPMLVVEGSGYRGELPGIFASPQAIGGGIADDARLKNIPGYSRTLLYKQFLANSSLASGGVFIDATGPWSS